MTSGVTKKGRLETETDKHTRRPPRGDEDRDWGEASTSKGTPKIAGKPPEARKRQEKFCPES